MFIMGKVLVIEGAKKITFWEYEERALESNKVRIKTLYSGISAGTQLTLYRGKSPFNTKVFDDEKRIFGKEESNDLLYPSQGAWGYEEVGEVVELGSNVKNIKVGDIIYGTWGHRTTNIVTEEFALSHKLAEGMNTIIGIYSQMGCIALNAILDANIHIGETVAVFGQGVPGQIVAQLARLNGATVIAVDLDDSRLEMSKKLGAYLTLNPNKCDAAMEIKNLTGKGVDKAIEISGFSQALHEAIRSTIYNGRVVCSGFIAQEAKGLFLGEEFHHNRIQIVCSQIEDVNPSVSNSWNRLRMEKTIMKLAQTKQLDLESIITHVIPFEDAEKAYKLLDQTTGCLQVVLKF